MAGPGMLYVTMQPHDNLSTDEFNDWYNNEHGPTRLRLPTVFASGLRYRAIDGEKPEFMAAYDVVSMPGLLTPEYTRLRAERSPRELAVVDRVDVHRHFFDLIYTRQASAPDFVAPEESLPDGADPEDGTVLVQTDVSLSDAPGAEEEVYRWYREEHFELLAKIPGWRRSRLFRASGPPFEATSSAKHSSAGPPGSMRHVALHEYAAANGLGGPEHKASMDTPWRTEVFDKYITRKGRRMFHLYYVFGPAPRDLLSLSKLGSSGPQGEAEKKYSFTSPDSQTKTTPPSSGRTAVISSYITVPADGLRIPYRLEGNSDPKAPTLAFCNSLLTPLEMWDPLVALIKAHRPEFRILRYDHRGRHGIPWPAAATDLDALTADLECLLTALRIRRLHALVGVSLGGITALSFALRHPDRLDRFVACDFNIASSPTNTTAWKSRITLAESEANSSSSSSSSNADSPPTASSATPAPPAPAPGVAPGAAQTNAPRQGGSRTGMTRLAAQTVQRWFHPHTIAEDPAATADMMSMVAANDLDGFRRGCRALWDYDLRGAAPTCRVPGLLVAGEGDGGGAIPKAMEGFRGSIAAGGTPLRLVPQAGHLPMFEVPGAFWEAVREFL